MPNPRYAVWLEIANELVVLHDFAYGPAGPFAHIKADQRFRPSGSEAAKWIRERCAKGRWYWLDRGWLAGKAEEPLRSFNRVIGDGGGRYEETEEGREMIARIDRLQRRIDVISRR